jgi:hypothetical protein
MEAGAVPLVSVRGGDARGRPVGCRVGVPRRFVLRCAVGSQLEEVEDRRADAALWVRLPDRVTVLRRPAIRDREARVAEQAAFLRTEILGRGSALSRCVHALCFGAQEKLPHQEAVPDPPFLPKPEHRPVFRLEGVNALGHVPWPVFTSALDEPA